MDPEKGNPNPLLGFARMAVALKQKRISEAMADGADSIADGEMPDGVPDGIRARPGIHEAHPFFHYYGLLIHQQNMLQDTIRTGTYHYAMMANADDFQGKTVMDVGTGSGILAYFAVKAGASKVYAVEASDVADRAAELMAANGLQDKITVLKQKVEEVVLPNDDKVDILVSEPMGFLLIHERMLESYIAARKRFLKPGGRMFPATGTIYVAPITDAALWQEQQSKIAFWNNSDFFGLNLTSMAAAAARDHFSQPVVGYVDASSFLSSSTAALTIDFEHDEPESLHELLLPFEFTIARTAVCHGLAAWFDVAFTGSAATVILTTAPGQPGTHWYQCRLLLLNPIAVNAGQRIAGTLRMKANERYSYNLTLSMSLVGSEATTSSREPVTSAVAINLHDQMYHYLTPAAAQ